MQDASHPFHARMQYSSCKISLHTSISERVNCIGPVQIHSDLSIGTPSFSLEAHPIQLSS